MPLHFDTAHLLCQDGHFRGVEGICIYLVEKQPATALTVARCMRDDDFGSIFIFDTEDNLGIVKQVEDVAIVATLTADFTVDDHVVHLRSMCIMQCICAACVSCNAFALHVYHAMHLHCICIMQCNTILSFAKVTHIREKILHLANQFTGESIFFVLFRGWNPQTSLSFNMSRFLLLLEGTFYLPVMVFRYILAKTVSQSISKGVSIVRSDDLLLQGLCFVLKDF